VVPLSAAHLPGATNLTLDGVLHSMSRIGTFEDQAPDECVWYGDGRVVDLWLPHLVKGRGRPAPAPAPAAATAGRV